MVRLERKLSFCLKQNKHISFLSIIADVVEVLKYVWIRKGEKMKKQIGVLTATRAVSY